MSALQPIAEPVRQLAPTPHSSFVIGQDTCGRWVAVEDHGLGGGLFRSRKDAVHYAMAETARRPDAIRIAGEPIEFKI